MPKFSYVVKDQEGKTYKNVTDEVSQQALVEKLQNQNYFVISIKKLTLSGPSKKKAGSKKERTYSRKGIKLEDLVHFARQLQTMLQAGVTLVRSIDVIQSQVESRQLAEILTRIKMDIEQGKNLSVALARHPKVFNQFWVSLIEVGEASGTIPQVLEKLSFYLEQQASFRSTIISGVMYPAVLFVVASGAIMFFALFVGPRFEGIFNTMKVELPLLTRILLASFRGLKENIFYIVGSITITIFLIKKYIQTYTGRLVWEKFLFNLPTFGEVFRLIIVERFASQMAILIDSGVPILYALDITERLVSNNTCALVVSSIKEGVKEGELLVTPMERSGFFPPMCTQMISVGEETGELSKMLKHVSGYYQQSVETFMKRFSTLIEPFMLVFMGAVIGIIVVAMFMPMFNIAQLGGASG